MKDDWLDRSMDDVYLAMDRWSDWRIAMSSTILGGENYSQGREYVDEVRQEARHVRYKRFGNFVFGDGI